MIITQNYASVTLEKTEQNVQGNMGLSWTFQSMKHFGLEKIINNKFPKKKSNSEIPAWNKIMSASLMLIAGGDRVEDIEKLRADNSLIKLEKIINNKFPKKKSNSEIPAWNKIMSASLMLIAGGDRVEDIEKLRADNSLINSLGWKSMISPDTLLNFTAEKRTAARLRQSIEEQVVLAMQRDKTDEYTYDNDATYADSEKDCATYSYKERKQVSGLLGFIPELCGLCITSDFRPGNISPATGILNQLRKAAKWAKKAGKKIARFRSDSAAHNQKIWKYCEKEGIKYFISLDQNKVIKESVKGIAEFHWQKLEGTDKEWAEFSYMPIVTKKNKGVMVRALALRWRKANPDLFDNYHYHVIGTNDWDIAPFEWLEFHNGRMGSEKYNSELKSGLNGKYTPSNDFNICRGYFMLTVLAYNVLQIMKLFYLDKEAESWTVKRIRYWFIETVGKFVISGRKVKCKLINCCDLTWKLFVSCQRRLILNW